MITADEEVIVVRDGSEVKVKMLELAVGDEFKHSGQWWQLTTSRMKFGQIENGHPFRFNHQWFEMDQEGPMRLAIVLNPNAPFGRRDMVTLPPAFELHVSVDALDLKMCGVED